MNDQIIQATLSLATLVNDGAKFLAFVREIEIEFRKGSLLYLIKIIKMIFRPSDPPTSSKDLRLLPSKCSFICIKRILTSLQETLVRKFYKRRIVHYYYLLHHPLSLSLIYLCVYN